MKPANICNDIEIYKTNKDNNPRQYSYIVPCYP